MNPTSDAFINSLRAKHADLSVDVMDVFNQDLPAVAGENIESKYILMLGQPIDITPALREAANTSAMKEANSLVADSDWTASKTAAPVEYPAALKPKPII